MLILQETTIIYYNTACCTPDDSRQYKTEKNALHGRAYLLLIQLPETWLNEANNDHYIYHLREFRDGKISMYFSFTTFISFNVS